MALVANKYSIYAEIGQGTYGSIYLGKDRETGQQVAIKMEDSSVRMPQLAHEAGVYTALNANSVKRHVSGIPQLFFYGRYQTYNVLVLQLLGPSLQDMLEFYGKFSLKTVLLIGDQLISRMEYIHSKGYLHRDIKPGNFVLDELSSPQVNSLGESSSNVRIKTDKALNKEIQQPSEGSATDFIEPQPMVASSSTIYAIDFGLSKSYRTFFNLRHIEYRENVVLTGTARFASLNNHRGIERSRRDDIESVIYLLIYVYNGSLPWQQIRAPNKKEGHRRIFQKKLQISAQELAAGMPDEFTTVVSYSRSLKFAERPDYDYIRTQFKQAFKRQGYVDNDFDWSSKDLTSVIEHKRKKRDLDIA